MRIMILLVLALSLAACAHAPVRCDQHLVPINPATKTPAASVPGAEHP